MVNIGSKQKFEKFDFRKKEKLKRWMKNWQNRQMQEGNKDIIK